MRRSQREQAVLEAVLSRAQVDPAFRHQLLTNPWYAIETAFGISIPPSFRIKFIEKEHDVDALVVLSDFQGHDASDEEDEDAGHDELSDQELETVAGGTEGLWSDDDPDDDKH